jgi:hypothetical protein
LLAEGCGRGRGQSAQQAESPATSSVAGDETSGGRSPPLSHLLRRGEPIPRSPGP